MYGVAMMGSILNRATKYSLVIGAVLIALFITMVQQFAHAVRHISDAPATIDKDQRSATGIVIATGSEGRLEAGLTLILGENADRLLISGTGAGVTKPDILRVANENGQLDEARLKQVIECCVDLDPAASNTQGNAIQSKQWADQHQLSQIILVTSDFHMPRAFQMFRAAMPDRTIIAHHVETPWLVPDQFGALRWWQSMRRVQIISREMVKYYAHRISGA